MTIVKFCGAVVLLLCTHTVLGFDLRDLFTALQQAEVENVRRSVQTPANAIVQLVQGVLDSDENEEISIAEVEAYIDLLLNHTFTPPGRDREAKGYFVTLAKLIDLNGDDKITRQELQRTAQILVDNVGSIQVANVISIILSQQRKFPSFSFEAQINNSIEKFMEIVDMNGDGELSNNELEVLFAFEQFRWYETLISDVESADENRDGKLNKTEALAFLNGLSGFVKHRVLVYVETTRLVGKEIADQWAALSY